MKPHRYLTNEEICFLLKCMNITPIEKIAGLSKSVLVKCDNCENKQSNKPSKIIDLNRGCRKCNGKQLSNKIVDERIKDRNLIRISDVSGADNKIKQKCSVCEYIWLASPDKVCNRNSGCPNCARNIKLDSQIVDLRLKDRYITRIDDFTSKQDSIRQRCDICGCEFYAKVIYVSVRTCCPACKNKNEGLVYEALKKEFIDQIIIREKRLSCDITHMNGIQKRLFVDFMVFNDDNTFYIEYNGDQHNRPATFGVLSKDVAFRKFDRQRKRDEQLKFYCLQNNIKLIIIPYTIKGSKIAEFIRTLSQEINAN